MTTTAPTPEAGEELERTLRLAVAPVHKRAFGMATGVTLGALVFLVTAYATIRGNAPWEMDLLANYFYGYTVSWTGAFVGFVWTAFAFFVAGWFAAFVRNFVIALSVWMVRTRAELEQTRDFLDHI